MNNFFLESECWYSHETNNDLAHDFNCTICDLQIKGRSECMKNKKEVNADITLNCSKFLEGKCNRANDVCWFNNEEAMPETGFQKVQEKTFPPDQIQQMLTVLSHKSTSMENVSNFHKSMCESLEDETLKGVEWNYHSRFAGRRSCIEWQAIPVSA